MLRSPQWAVNIIHTCMGVQAGEKLLIVVDEPLSHVREALLHEAALASPGQLWTFTFPDAVRPFSEYPAELLSVAAEMDAIVLLLANVDPGKELAAWVAGREAIRHGKVRFGAGAYIDQAILEHELSADYEWIGEFTLSLADQLQGCSTAHITTESGTDLHITTAGRTWRTDTGMLRGRGVYGNLPAGEVFIAPVETSAEGVLIIDKSLPGLLLDQPVRLTFEQGQAINIEGGRGAEYLRDAIARHGEATRVIAELGIGTNPQARLQGNIMTDEKVLGTLHIAIGRNDFLGGVTTAGTHIDGVIGRPTLELDGRVLIRNGEFLSES